MRIKAPGNIGVIAGRKLAVALTAVCVLAAGLVAAPTPAAGQSDAGIRIYGNSPPDHFPSLHGPADGWRRVKNPPGRYGLDHHGEYAYTYGNSDPAPSNWASWSFTVPDNSIYDVWVWVPGEDATAQVNYKLNLTGCTHPLGVYPTLDQQNYTGWVQIGRVALDRIEDSPSNNLSLKVLDNEVSDAHESQPRRSIGVSVALLERNYNMGWERQTNSNRLLTDERCFGSSQTIVPRVDLSEPRNVRVVAGDGRLTVSWDAPSRTEGLYDYDVEYRCAGSTRWAEWSPEEISTRRSATITELTNGVACDIRVWAHNYGLNAQSGGYAHASGTPISAQLPFDIEDCDLSRQSASSGVPRTKTTSRGDEHIIGCTGTWSERSTGGWWKLGKNTYKFSRSRDALAIWDMGDLQGTFKLVWDNPTSSGNSASIQFMVLERRASADQYQVVEALRTPSPRGKRGWWHFSNLLALDGDVLIVATRTSDGRNEGQRLEIDGVRLGYVGLHPAHINSAKMLCVATEIADHNFDAFVWERLDQMIPSVPGLDSELASDAATAADTVSGWRAYLRKYSTSFGKRFLNVIAAWDTVDDTLRYIHTDSANREGLRKRLKTCDEPENYNRYLSSHMPPKPPLKEHIALGTSRCLRNDSCISWNTANCDEGAWQHRVALNRWQDLFQLGRDSERSGIKYFCFARAT